MPYFSGRWVYWLGRLHDSNSASSRGVTARNEKVLILFLGRLQQKRARVTAASKTSVPRTAARMIHTFSAAIVMMFTGSGVVSRSEGLPVNILQCFLEG